MRVLYVIADAVLTALVGLTILAFIRIATETHLNVIDWLISASIVCMAVKWNIKREQKKQPAKAQVQLVINDKAFDMASCELIDE